METSESIKKGVKSAVLASYCFYELDNKYSAEKNNQVINNWLNKKSNFVLSNETIDNIFDHNGGGPNGAEWNPSNKQESRSKPCCDIAGHYLY